MMRIKHTFIVGIIATYFGLAVTGPALTQTYPSRPITIIVPFPPGNNADLVARFLADRLTASLGPGG
jgi:tripartite-type tricarboxylate transporter receptor subunit TctC